jgi:hypothetical protein
MLLFAIVPVAYSEGDSGLFIRLVNNGRLILEPEPLDYYLKLKLYRALDPVLALPTDAYQIVAVVGGGLYILAAVELGRVLGRGRSESFIVLAGLLAIANVLFFFRYIENYALLSAASLWVIWAAWQYIEGKVPFVVPAAISTITCLLHESGVVWLPMVLAAWILRARRQHPQERWRRRGLKEATYAALVSLALVALFVAIIALDGYMLAQFQAKIAELGGKGSGMFIPIVSTEGMPEPYAFFSWSHLGAVNQEQALAALMALPTIVAILLLAWKEMHTLVRQRPALLTLFLGAGVALIYSLVWNPDLGPRNDWDLLALPALPLTALAVYLLLQLPDGKPKRLALTAYLSLAFVHTLGWVILHTHGIHY